MAISDEQLRAAGIRLTNILGLVQQILIPTLNRIAQNPDTPELERKVMAETVFALLGIIKQGVNKLTLVPDATSKDLTSNDAAALSKTLDNKVQAWTVRIGRELAHLATPVSSFEDEDGTKIVVELSDAQKAQSEEIISRLKQRLKDEASKL